VHDVSRASLRAKYSAVEPEGCELEDGREHAVYPLRYNVELGVVRVVP
jgi:hypothetical protein